MQIISEEEYLLQRGFGALSDYGMDHEKLPHGETRRQKEKRLKTAKKAIDAFYEGKKAARKEYQEKVKQGEIRPPTVIESAIQAANGPEESEQTQAARRYLKKRGIYWGNN